MDYLPFLIPGAATMAVLGMVYLLFIYWVRRPGRQREVAACKAENQASS